MRTRRNTNRLYVNVSFFLNSLAYFLLLYSLIQMCIFLIQNQNIISVNSLLRQLFNICVNRRRLYGLSFLFISLWLNVF